MADITFRILGPLEVWNGDERRRVEGPKLRALLAALLVDANEVVSTDRLTAALWPASPPSREQLNALQTHVSRLRTMVGPADAPGAPRIVSHGSGYLLRVGDDELDALTFEALSRRARQAIAAQDWAAAVDHADEALRCWRGDALQELRHQEFARARAIQLEEERLLTTECRIDAGMALGQHSELVGRLEALVVEHPLRESLWCQLVLALYRSGRQSDALRACDRVRRILATELGVEPGVELANLQRAVLAHDPSLDQPRPDPTPSASATTAPPSPPSPHMGTIAAGSAPREQPEPTTSATTAATATASDGAAYHNLPVQLTSLVGRPAERAAVAEELRRSRMITLCGTGGCGKTRLALTVAEHVLPRFPGGVCFVDFSPFADPALVDRALAEALDIAGEARHIDHVCRHIGQAELLLVFDNCEHLVDAIALAAEKLLAACPSVQILATSREELRVASEVVWRVPGLSLPSADGADGKPFEESEAVELFVQRGRSALADFSPTGETQEHVAAICRRLDGMPLAIELAAALVGSLPVADIAAKLDDRFRLLTEGRRHTIARHRTLQAALDWSFDLLDEPDQQLFVRLGVFVGDFTLAAAETVAGVGDDPVAVARGLRRLVATSMVSCVGGGEGAERYRLLETVRQYAYERLQQLDIADDVGRRHARYYADFADVAEDHVRGSAAPEWLWRVVSELSNLRAAVTWTIENDDVETGLRLASSLRWYFDRMGLLNEAARWLDVWLAHEAELPPALRLRALTTASTVAFMQGDFSHTRRWGQEGVALAREIQDQHQLALALIMQGSAAVYEGDQVRAEECLAEAEELCARSGDRWARAWTLSGWGIGSRRWGHMTRARKQLTEALDIFRSMGDRHGQVLPLIHLALAAEDEGDMYDAVAFVTEALEAAHEVRDRTFQHVALCSLGRIELSLDHRHRARELLVGSIRGFVGSHHRLMVAIALEGLAGLAVLAEHHGDAAALFGFTDDMAARAQFVMSGLRARERVAWMDRARTEMRAEQFGAELRRGRNLNLEDAVNLAEATTRLYADRDAGGGAHVKGSGSRSPLTSTP